MIGTDVGGRNLTKIKPEVYENAVPFDDPLAICNGGRGGEAPVGMVHYSLRTSCALGGARGRDCDSCILLHHTIHPPDGRRTAKSFSL